MIATIIVKLQVVASKYYGDVLKGVQLDNTNYNIWRHKI